MEVRGVATILLVSAALILSSSALSPSSYLTPADKTKLKVIFDSAQPFPDLATTYYAVLGYKLLGEQVLKAQELCKTVQSQVDAKNVESIFYASGISKALGSCPLAAATYQQTLNSAIVDGVTSQNLYFSVAALKNLGLAVDSVKVSKVLTATRKKDDGVLSLGYAFHTAAQLSGDVSTFVPWIEDAVMQADEVDSKLLQFEGGLSISAIVISGVYRLAEHAKKAPPALDGEKCVKFANYFLSRKQVPVVRAAYHLLDVLQVLSENKYHIPVATSLVSKAAIPAAQPVVSVRISNLLGGSLGQVAVTLESATKSGVTTPVSIKQPFTLLKGESQVYELNLASFKLGRGLQQFSINSNLAKPDPRWVGNTGAIVSVNFITDVAIENVEVGVGDVDQATAPHLTKVQHPSKLPAVLEADSHQKLQLKFTLKDKQAGDVMNAHQAFVLLTHASSGREIAFVAYPEASNSYKFDLDVQAQAKSFGSLSGRYQIALVVGDSVIANPLFWNVADIELKFHDPSVERVSSQTSYFAAKPEIKHLFREPEKRPPHVVSTAFTGILFVPLIILFVLWGGIGANVSNFKFTLGTVGFHLGLAGIFGLFIVFWLKLTMFQTLKYLIILGILTFLAGNNVLSKLAHKGGGK